jgi:beta-glucosidase
MRKLFSFAVLIAALQATAQLVPTLREDYKQFPMWNYNLPFEQRVNDVVSRLTLEEKVAQMLNATPAVTRLGIPAYDWWNETLHGVARTPFKVTSYPQAIAMAATWDTNSLYRMADYSALEGRAIYNKAIELGRTNERYLGLTYWTPNINIFRDPRWGRGQETYGEDPFLTTYLAKAFVRGLQGEDPKYLKAAACAKHFAVHSGPEPSRHSDNFNPTTYDLWDTYLPAFKELVVNANVAGVMCAYNAVDKQPCCANDQLMNDILRKQWNFTGYVTSDCWAIDDFFRYHKTHKDSTSAAIDAVIHGTDLECGRTVYLALIDAVKKGLIKESQLDISLRRLFTIRYRLGMFDPVSMVKYAQTPSSILESDAHKAHALKMAQQSIVLLKNESNTLPLNKKIKKIAVVGPNADNKIAVLGNYNGTPSKVVSLLEGIKEKLGNNVEVVYEKAINFTNDTLLVHKDISSLYKYDGKPGVKAEYFTNEKLEGTPVLTLAGR